ncbi:ONEC2 protein, partial [Formicarius rufipectus]|nr:ONEC2 protein [Formicarius rufipectus]
ARPAMVPSMASLLDGAAEYRPELSIPLHHAMSVPCEASPPGMGMSGTYTTLTPLQPLPPISAEVPPVGQSLSPLGNGLGPLPGAQQGLHGYGPPGHDKMLSPNFEAMLARAEQPLPRGLATPPAPPLFCGGRGGQRPPHRPPLPPLHRPPAAPTPRRSGAHPGELPRAVRAVREPPQRGGCPGVAAAARPPVGSAGRAGLAAASPPRCGYGDTALTRVGRTAARGGAGARGSALTGEMRGSCKRKEQEPSKERNNSQKKSRLVFTDLQRRTLFAIFKENKRPSKEMQMTISQQLGLELNTVSNFFMNARRRSLEKWQDDLSSGGSSSAPSTCPKA